MPAPTPLDALAPTIRLHHVWPFARTRAYTVPYRAWDDKTVREATIVLPSGWDRAHQSHSLPLVISPHGRNNFGWGNAAHYWQELPAQGPFALVCPDGLGRAHDKASNPLDQPPHDPSLFTYGYRRWIDDLARMPKIVQETLPWLHIDLERIYVLGSSMGGQETLLLAARYPGPLSAGTGRLAGAAAFDSACDLPAQCAYLTSLPATHGADPHGVAARMIQEIDAKPADLRGFRQGATFFNTKQQRHMTIAEHLSELPRKPSLWNGATLSTTSTVSPISRFGSASTGAATTRSSATRQRTRQASSTSRSRPRTDPQTSSRSRGFGLTRASSSPATASATPYGTSN